MIDENAIKMYNLIYQGFKAGLNDEQNEKIDNAVTELKELMKKHKVYGLVSLAHFFLETSSNTDLLDDYIDEEDESVKEMIDKLQGLVV